MDKAENIDLLFDSRSKPLHGHIIADCYPIKIHQDGPMKGFVKKSSPDALPCVIETIPRSRIPVEYPARPDKAHPTKGDKRQESEPMFSQFADCNTMEKILHFADKFGRLTREHVGIDSPDAIYGIDTIPG